MDARNIWSEKLMEFPEHVRKQIEQELTRALVCEHDYTLLRPLHPDEPVITGGCNQWPRVNDRLVHCENPVTHVRYMAGGPGHGMPTYWCAEAASKWNGSSKMNLG